jgi:hypothetical protein
MEEMDMSRTASGVSRRTLLRGAALAAGIAGSTALVGPQCAHAQAHKQAKADAGYQDHPNGQQRCSGCTLFMAPSACVIVEGEISPNGWCRSFKAMG